MSVDVLCTIDEFLEIPAGCGRLAFFSLHSVPSSFYMSHPSFTFPLLTRGVSVDSLLPSLLTR
jgi:hypothetical protein